MTNSWISVCSLIICLVLGIKAEPPIRADDVDDIEEFPWNAAIVRVNDESWFPCSAAIISQRHVVTSASCVRDDRLEDMHVTAGSSIFKEGTEYKLKSIYVHPNFSEVYPYHNEIAVIELDGEIKFDRTKSPIALPDKDVPVRATVTLVGWANSQHLKKQNLIITENKVCDDIWGSYEELNDLPLYPSQACVLPVRNEPSCQSNMGSPVVYENALVAIAIGATPCWSGIAEIFTRVYQHVDWIREVMSK